MRRSLTIAVLTAGLVACQAGSRSDQSASVDLPEDIAAIRAHSDAFDSAITAGEEQPFINLLTDDVMWMVPNQPALVGREPVRNRIQGLFSTSSLQLRSTVDEIHVAGEWAYVLGTYHLRVTPKESGAPTEEVGKLINILRKDPNGSWRLARHLWNADHAER